LAPTKIFFLAYFGIKIDFYNPKLSAMEYHRTSDSTLIEQFDDHEEIHDLKDPNEQITELIDYRTQLTDLQIAGYLYYQENNIEDELMNVEDKLSDLGWY
jgi:hypothetical protein